MDENQNPTEQQPPPPLPKEKPPPPPPREVQHVPISREEYSYLRSRRNPNFVCPITFNNALPDPQVDAKFLPYAQDMQKLVEKPILVPEIDCVYTHYFRGLHLLFDIDLVNPSTYDNSGTFQPLEEREGAQLVHIDTLECKPINRQLLKPRVPIEQKMLEQATKERAYPTPTRRPNQLPATPYRPGLLSRRQQISIVERTFVDIKGTLRRHPTKPYSDAVPVEILPLLPAQQSSNEELTFAQFDQAARGGARSLLMNCGTCIILMRAHMDALSFSFRQDEERYVRSDALSSYFSGQRYLLEDETSIDKSDENGKAKAAACYVSHEADGQILYTQCRNKIKLSQISTEKHMDLLTKVQRISEENYDSLGQPSQKLMEPSHSLGIEEFNII